MRRRGLLIIATFFLGIVLADYLYPPVFPAQGDGFAKLVVDRNGEPLRAFADAKGVWRYEVSSDEVSPRYLEALLGYEDRYFFQHPGVNPISLVRAGWQWANEGEVISGGSTLTMQVVRILHRHPRTVTGKIQQVLRALQLEWYLTKDEILTIYLNHAPFGGTIEGVQAASLQYLNKPAKQLRHSEAALLAVLPQAPSKLRPDRNPELAQKYRDKVLSRLSQSGVWHESTVAEAAKEDVAAWPPENPLDAPLLSRRLIKALPAQRLITTTIDRELQQQFTDHVKAYTSNLDDAISAAVLLVDNRNHEVLAYVGSASFLNQARAGHVDMVNATRSPGSTLKPFLYGLSLDKGLIHSESLLADVPRIGKSYRPGNFSSGFSGPVSAGTALQRSLNIPFVQLIEAYGAENFANKLKHVQVPLKIPGGKANPSIVLGGAGISLEQLVTLYTAFANGGYVKPLSLIQGIDSQLPRRLLSQEAAWITWDALRAVKKPDGFRFGLTHAQLPDIGWKTGTSWDYRDVWALGVSARFTLGVWLGRPDGKPMPKTSGRQLAGPLLFSLFERLEDEVKSLQKPENVLAADICWPDGRRASLVVNGCVKKRTAYTIAGLTPRTLNPAIKNRELYFNTEVRWLQSKKTGLRLSRDCANENAFELRSLHLWPSALEPWLPPSIHQRREIPAFDPACKSIVQQRAEIRIAGIHSGQVFHAPAMEFLSLPVVAEGAGNELNWYLNGELLPSKNKEVLLELHVKRKYELLVFDKSGASSRVVFKLI